MQLAQSTHVTKILAYLISAACLWGIYSWWNAPKSEPKATKDPIAELRVRAITYGQIALESRLKDPNSVKYDFKAVNLDNGALCYSYSSSMTQGKTAIVEGKFAGFEKHCPKGASYERY